MQHIISALIPIFSLILIGYFFRQIRFPSEGFWPSADRLTYYVLMPSLLVYKLSTASLDSLDGFNFVSTGIAGILVLLVIVILLNKKMKMQGASFTSVVQGTVRFNTYVFLALSASMFGDDGLVLSALLITFAIPLINIICITVFALYVNDSKLTFLSLLKSIVTNPLILACFIGGGINYIGFTLPVPVEKIFYILSAAALPMGLLSVGVGLELKGLMSTKNELFIATSFKLLLMPLIMYAIGTALDLNTIALSVILIFAAMPTAPSSFVLARQLGGNVKLMSSIITLQTLVSIFTIAFIIQMVVK
jgi:hypothetical protein